MVYRHLSWRSYARVFTQRRTLFVWQGKRFRHPVLITIAPISPEHDLPSLAPARVLQSPWSGGLPPIKMHGWWLDGAQSGLQEVQVISKSSGKITLSYWLLASCKPPWKTCNTRKKRIKEVIKGRTTYCVCRRNLHIQMSDSPAGRFDATRCNYGWKSALQGLPGAEKGGHQAEIRRKNLHFCRDRD